MIPTASSLYMRTPLSLPFSYGGQQQYYTGGSYSVFRIPYGAPIGQQSPMVHSSGVKPLSTQTLTSNSVVMNEETPVTTRRFNSYKENTAQSILNASSASVRPPGSQAIDRTGTVPSDFGHMLKQAVAEAVRSEKLQPVELKQLEEALLKEREERKNLKNQFKTEKKQNDVLSEKLTALEKNKADLETALKRSERETSNRGKELEILQNEISELRNEKILSEQLDEEHSAKMKVYTQDLMATSLKYQQDIQILIGKNEKLVKEVEVLKAKCAELDRQNAHNDQVQEALNRKLLAKDNEIAAALQGKSISGTHLGKIKELEAIIAAQKAQISEQDVRFKALLQAPRSQDENDDVFGILRSSKSLTPARRVSHLTSRREPASYAPVTATSDYAEWLEPLAIAEHVLSGATKA